MNKHTKLILFLFARSLDLIVFRELISKMAGVQIIDEISNDQLQGRSGGLVLRAQTNVLSRLSGSMRKAGKKCLFFLDSESRVSLIH